MERELIREYERTAGTLIDGLDAGNHETAVAIAALPDRIRGFGHVKLASVEEARAAREALLEEFRKPSAPPAAA